MQKIFSYYQFKPEKAFQVYVRFEDFDLESQCADILEQVGFVKVEREKIKNLECKRNSTRILKISQAHGRVEQDISRTDFSSDRFGFESLNSQGDFQVYRYKNAGLMLYSNHSLLWELGLKLDINVEGFKTILARFLSLSLESQGIVGFWGYPTNEGVVVTNSQKASQEMVLIDIENKFLIATGEVVDLSEIPLSIIRHEDVFSDRVKPMSSEELLAFLSQNTTYLSYSGLTSNLRKAIYSIAQVAHGMTISEPRALSESHAA